MDKFLIIDTATKDGAVCLLTLETRQHYLKKDLKGKRTNQRACPPYQRAIEMNVGL